MITVIPFSIIYNNSKNTVIDELGTHAVNIAITVASFIEEDLEPYKELSSTDSYTKGNYDEDYYEKMLGLFQKIKRQAGVDYIFTEKKLSNTEVAYILDGEDPDSENFSFIGSIDRMSTLEFKVFNEGTTERTDIVKDEKWGYYITGYAPIIDKPAGEVVGVVGVDFSTNYIKNVLILLSRMFLIIVLVINSMLSILFYYLLNEYNKKLGTDYMTGLTNRGYHDKYLLKVIRDAQTKGHPLSLIMIDVDGFKGINDRYGHQVGDIVLKTIAQILKRNIRGIDECSRYGGDEFVIVLPKADQSNAVSIAERIREKVSSKDFSIEGLSFNSVTLSIGIAEWKQDMTAQKLIEHADQALYLSKSTGRNKVTIYCDLIVP